MKVERVRSNLLEEATQDYVGLHEIVWDLASDDAHGTEEERIHAAQTLIAELRQSCDVRIFRTDTWPPKLWVAVPPDEYFGILSSAESWRVPAEVNPATLFWLTIESTQLKDAGA